MFSILGSKNKDIDSALEELRGRLSAKNAMDETELNRKAFLTRYLKLNFNDIDKAEQQLQSYIKYTKENDTNLMQKWTANNDEIVFNCILGAVDHYGNPVVQSPYGCRYDIASFMDSGKDDLFVKCADKLHWSLEKILQETNTEAGTLIVNLKGVSYRQYLNKRTFKAAVDYIRHILNMSPGAIERVIAVNAPKIVKVVIQAIRKIMPFPQDVIVFSEQDADWQKKLLDYAPADQLCPEFGGTFRGGHYML